MRLGWLVVPAVGVAACVGALAWQASEQASPRSERFRQLDLFAVVYATTKQNYVTEVDDEKAIEAAIQGMLGSLDPHSSYLNPESLKDMDVQTKGEYGGLGLEVTNEDGVVKVISPIDDTPAARQGIRAGDYLTAINGESIVGMPLNEAVDKMRGPPGTSILITVAREGSEPFDVNFTREIIKPKSVTWKMDGNIGVIRISAFNEKTGDALDEALRSVRREAGPGLGGLIVDLRNNPGGLLDQAVRVSDAFLSSGVIVSLRGRDTEDQKIYTATRNEIIPTSVPVVALINGGSASASEIVAGALKDSGRGIVVGVTSFGKGSVQTVIPVRGGKDGALKLTTGRYYTPSGGSIQGAGIEPDFEVAQVRAEPGKNRRAGLSEADLPKSMQNEAGLKRRGPHEITDQPPEGWDVKDDWQMKRAKELLSQGMVAARLAEKAG
jgi:carboxyl-terminal processing protease